MFGFLRKGDVEVMRRVGAVRKQLSNWRSDQAKAQAGAVGEEVMREQAALARERAEVVREDLRAQMVGAFTAYDATIRYARERLKTVTDPKVRREILEDLQQVRITTERGLQAAIRGAYSEQMRLGKRAGWNWRDLDKAESRSIMRLRREEYAFVTRFLDDIGADRLKMPVERRAALYGNAGLEAFWQGFLYADQSSGRYLQWRMSEAESCPDCLFLAGNLPPQERDKYDNPNPDLQHGGRWGVGVYTAQELARLAIVPQSGELRCTTNCKCKLVDVERPPGKPSGPLQRQPFQSLAPKPVGEKYEKKRAPYRTRRVKRDGKLERGGGLKKALLALIRYDLRRRRR